MRRRTIKAGFFFVMLLPATAVEQDEQFAAP